MDDLNALFDSVDGLKQDLIEYGTVAAGAIGANVLWNVAVAKFVPATLNPTIRKYGLPVAAAVAGITLGRYVSKSRVPQAHRLGLGVTIGLVTAGLTSLVKQFAPQLPIAGTDDPLYGLGAGYAGYLNGAPTTVEDMNGLGAVVVEEAVAGAPMQVEDVAGFASVMQ